MTAEELASLKNLGADIRDAVYKTSFSEWTYENKAAVSTLEAAADEEWKGIDAAAEIQQAWLDDSLARETLKEETSRLIDRHGAVTTRIISWAGEKKTYLEGREEVSSVSEVDVACELLEAFTKELEVNLTPQLASLRSLGAEIAAAKHSSSLSNWHYDEVPKILGAESQAEAALAELKAPAAARKVFLDELHAREVKRENLRLEYANGVTSFKNFIVDTLVSVKALRPAGSGGQGADDPQGAFGHSLDDVDKFGVALASEDAAIMAEASSREKLFSNAAAALQADGLEYAIHSALTLDDCNVLKEDLAAGLRCRRELFSGELERYVTP